MKLRRIECAVLLTLALLFTYAAAASAGQSAVASGLLRLHVVAHSDTPHDQEIKLMVRDAVLDFCAPLLDGAENREEVRARLLPQMQALADCAEQTLLSAGERRTVTVKLAEEYYPTRDYATFSLPAGEYLGLRVTIGEGAGHNWWCVVFPPLCNEAAAGETVEPAAKNIAPRYALRFKTAEAVGRLRHRLFS